MYWKFYLILSAFLVVVVISDNEENYLSNIQKSAGGTRTSKRSANNKKPKRLKTLKKRRMKNKRIKKLKKTKFRKGNQRNKAKENRKARHKKKSKGRNKSKLKVNMIQKKITQSKKELIETNLHLVNV